MRLWTIICLKSATWVITKLDLNMLLTSCRSNYDTSTHHITLPKGICLWSALWDRDSALPTAWKGVHFLRFSALPTTFLGSVPSQQPEKVFTFFLSSCCFNYQLSLNIQYHPVQGHQTGMKTIAPEEKKIKIRQLYEDLDVDQYVSDTRTYYLMFCNENK